MTKRICKIDGCGKPHRARGFCRRHYAAWMYNNKDRINLKVEKRTKIDTFIKYALKYEADECLLWPFAVHSKGYGQVTVSGKITTAHRHILEMSKGPPPHPKNFALHAPIICHNRLCVNKRHLRWGSQLENDMDRVIDGTSPNKLTSSDVVAIRSSCHSELKLAQEYNVSKETIRRAILRRTYKHVK